MLLKMLLMKRCKTPKVKLKGMMKELQIQLCQSVDGSWQKRGYSSFNGEKARILMYEKLQMKPYYWDAVR